MAATYVKKHKYFSLCVIELIVFLIITISVFTKEKVNHSFTNQEILLIQNGEISDNSIVNNIEGTAYFESGELPLSKGIYEITVDYSCDGANNNITYWASGGESQRLSIDAIYLNENKHTVTYEVWVNDDLNGYKVNVNYGGNGSLEVSRIAIRTAWNSGLYTISKVFGFLILFNLVCLYFDKRRKGKTDDLVTVVILATAFLASAISFTGYGIAGHDLSYHLLRIEGLKDNILIGQIPSRIQPNWSNGWGYPVSIMYGDLVLILPAILRVLGFSVMSSYNGFIFAINLATAYTSYFSFHKICKDKNASLVMSAVYTLSIYRLADIYVRAAIGEYAAMLFLPLIAAGIYGILTGKLKRKESVFYLVAGTTGIIQTHVLTCVMVAIFFVLVIAIAYKSVLKVRVWVDFLQAGIWTLIINLWFIIPFLKFMKEPLNILNEQFIGKIQNRGITLAELFAPYFNSARGYHWDALESLNAKPSLGIGSATLIILVVFFIAKKRYLDEKKNNIALTALSVGGIVALWMSTNLFPYNAIDSTFPFITKIIAKVKLPYRYLSIAGILIAVMGCLLFSEIRKKSKEVYRLMLLLLLSVSMMQASQYVYSMLYANGMQLCYSGTNLNTAELIGAEYLYYGSMVDSTFKDDNYYAQNAVVEDFYKDKGKAEVTVSETADDAFISVPLFYYPGFKAYDSDNKQSFKVVRDDANNNRAKVLLPAGYTGTLKVQYKESKAWIMLDLISFITLIVFLFYSFELAKNRNMGKVAEYISVSKKFLAEKYQYLSKKNKDKSNARFRWSAAAFFIVGFIMFIFIFILNIKTGWVSDDFLYHFFFYTGGNPGAEAHRFRIWEVVKSMQNHWRIFNGRLVAHGMLQIVLSFGRLTFRIVNSLCFVYLGVIIYKHTGSKKKYASALLLIYALMWRYLPQFGLTTLWASGSANYLWTACVCMTFLYIFRKMVSKNPEKYDHIKEITGMLFFGMLAGCTNENSGGSVMIILFFCMIQSFIKRKKISKWMITSFIGCFVGTLVLIKAPGNGRLGTNYSFEVLLNQFRMLTNIVQRELKGLLILVVLLLLVRIVISCLIKEKIQLAIFYFLCAALASFFVMIFSPLMPERTLFIGTVYLIYIVCDNYVWLCKKINKPIGLLVALVSTYIIVSIYIPAYKDVNETYQVYYEGVKIIKEAKKAGIGEVTIPMVNNSPGKYNGFDGFHYIREDANDWTNMWAAKYFGMEKIHGKP